ncbi:MAG: glycosyltransferase [Eubacteriales bacterium]|nr:glycosyltransferase [Eubacteriales bacterium]
MPRESKFVSAVMYLHNDEARIEAFLSMVTKALAEGFEKYELIFVNDASADASVARLYEFFSEHQMDGQMVSIIQMSHFQGLEAAMNAGRDLAIGDFVYEFDDLCVDYEPGVLDVVYRRMLEGFDIVAACSDGRPRLTSALFYELYNSVSHDGGKIGPEAFRILSRRAINRVKTLGSYIPYRKAVYRNCGLNADTVIYRSTMGPGKKTVHTNQTERASLAVDSFIYFTDILEKISLWVSALFLGITIFMAGYILYEYFGADQPVEGWLSTMGFLSLGFMGVFMLLTIVLKYLSLLLNLIFKRQRYLIAGVEKIVH